MTDVVDSPAYTRHHWAKSEPHVGYPKRIHLLEHHLADVGACFEALMRQPTIRKRLAATGGLEDLDESLVARLSVFAAIHDIGKANVGFQAQIWRPEDLQGRPKPGRGSHDYGLIPVIMDGDKKTATWFFAALGWDEMTFWDDAGGETACAMLVAALSHHGKPLQLDGTDVPGKNPRLWQPFGSLRPEDCVQYIGRALRRWFPGAFASDSGTPLPDAPPFQHMFLGLCNWADWIGSNEKWFPFVEEPDDSYMERARQQAAKAMDAMGLDLSAQRESFAGMPDFGKMFVFDPPATPNAIQQKAKEVPLDERLVIIESETGSGKTEAALWRFAAMYQAGLVDGLYFALPTRAAAVQIHQRVKDFASNLFTGGHVPPVVLAVPGYDPGEGASDIEMQDYKVWWDDHDQSKPWAAEHPKRFLAAQIAVGTVDQAMLGALQVKNAHMRTACLARNLLVVDEVHASDTYMSEVLKALLDAHRGAGGYALLMSATLGSVARHRWLDQSQNSTLEEAEKADYPAVSTQAGGVQEAGENDQGKQVCVEAVPEMHDWTGTARMALEAARDGAKVLVVRNTVGYAVKVHQALEDLAGPNDDGLLLRVNGIATLHHGRFANGDRKLLDEKIEELLGRKSRRPGGCVVVGTQTLEQSLDIDADLLITDLCPMDVLLQRIGRLHRHRANDLSRPADYQTPKCTVLTPPDHDLSPLLKDTHKANGLGPHGFVYMSLTTLEATRRLIGEHPEWRIPEMNRLLVERATHPEALKSITDQKGPEWQKHARSVMGGGRAEKQEARNVTIERNRSFLEDVSFVSDDQTIRTRLGDDRVNVDLDPPQPSPLGGSRSIAQLSLPRRWLGDADVPKSAVTPTQTDEGFEFTIGEERFRYDRLGLRHLQGRRSPGDQ